MDGADCQIMRAIRAYTNWKNAPKAAVVMHVSTPTIDHLRVQGSPCLQFAEITRPSDDRLDIFAVYRNHDFVEKALGNFVGLARLLRFICRNTGYNAGSLICHSVHAYGQKQKLQALMAK
jgi:thymidylate synthase